MAKNKKQHIIPKFYLGLFSHTLESNKISLFSISNEKFLSGIPFKDQAYENYFYGKDHLMENHLSKFENKAKAIISKIIESNKLPENLSNQYIELLVFVILLLKRTKASAEEIKEITNNLFQTAIMHSESMKEYRDKVFYYPKVPATFSIANTIDKISSLFDLRLKLIVNKTQTPLIISDNPVITYNQFLEQRKHPGGHTGFSSKGLQILVPISPNHLLCYYDDWVYKIGNKNNDVIETYDKRDIDQLNYLQSLNFHEQLFFNERVNENYIRQLYYRSLDYRNKENIITNFTEVEKSNDGTPSIQYHTYVKNLSSNLNLSFITLTKKAKQHKFNDYFVQIRNEKLRNVFNQI